MFDTDSGEYTYEFSKTIAKITKNCSYENYPKWIDSYFNTISRLFKKVTKNNIDIIDSHKFIEAMMIIYNNLFTHNLINLKNQLFIDLKKNLINYLVKMEN